MNRVGRVPLRIKIFGIVIASTSMTGLAVILWTHLRLRDNSAALAFTTDTPALKELAVAVAAALAVGLSVAWVLTNVLTHQVSEITQVVRRVQGGDLSLRVPVWANDEIGALARAFNALIDSETQSRQWLMKANKELTALNELALLTTHSLGRDSVLSTALEKALEISRCDAGMILLTKGAGALTLLAEQGLPAALRDQVALNAANETLLSRVLHSGLPIQASCTDHQLGAPPSRFLAAAASSGFDRVYALPIQAHSVVSGVLVLFQQNQSSNPPDETTMPSLAAIYSQLSVVVENTMLWEELTRKEATRARLLATAVNAQEKERERISRELHDETGQALTALLIQLKVLERLHNPKDIAAHAAQLRTLVIDTLEEVRRLARDLRPGMLDELGLIPTLEWYLRAFGRNTDLVVEFETTTPPGFRLPVHTELALYRVVQEALTNVVRHAQATRAQIRLELLDSHLRLIIQDNGCGFDVHVIMTVGEQGVGLLGIQERVELIGGDLTLESSSLGTRLRVDVPILERIEKEARL